MTANVITHMSRARGHISLSHTAHKLQERILAFFSLGLLQKNGGAGTRVGVTPLKIIASGVCSKNEHGGRFSGHLVLQIWYYQNCYLQTILVHTSIVGTILVR